jgi:hypothetical protein
MRQTSGQGLYLLLRPDCPVGSWHSGVGSVPARDGGRVGAAIGEHDDAFDVGRRMQPILALVRWVSPYVARPCAVPTAPFPPGWPQNRPLRPFPCRDPAHA